MTKAETIAGMEMQCYTRFSKKRESGSGYKHGRGTSLDMRGYRRGRRWTLPHDLGRAARAGFCRSGDAGRERLNPLDQFGLQALRQDIMPQLRQVNTIVQEYLVSRVQRQRVPAIDYTNIRPAGKISDQVATVTARPGIRQKVVKYKGGENNRIGAEGNHRIDHLRNASPVVSTRSNGPCSQGETGATPEKGVQPIFQPRRSVGRHHKRLFNRSPAQHLVPQPSNRNLRIGLPELQHNDVGIVGEHVLCQTFECRRCRTGSASSDVVFTLHVDFSLSVRDCLPQEASLFGHRISSDDTGAKASNTDRFTRPARRVTGSVHYIRTTEQVACLNINRRNSGLSGDSMECTEHVNPIIGGLAYPRKLIAEAGAIVEGISGSSITRHPG